MDTIGSTNSMKSDLAAKAPLVRKFLNYLDHQALSLDSLNNSQLIRTPLAVSLLAPKIQTNDILLSLECSELIEKYH